MSLQCEIKGGVVFLEVSALQSDTELHIIKASPE